MIEKIKQKIKEEIIKLPKEKQEAMGSFDWMGKVEEIGKKHLLTESELDDFQLETMLVLLGLVSIDLYTNNIENNIGTSKDEAKQITSEVFDEIFTPMANYIETPKINKQFVFDQNFSRLPQNVQEAIANSNWKEKLYEVARKYKLTISQMGTLEEMTAKVIKNDIHSDKYEEELSSKITIPKEDMGNLLNDINEQILKSIRGLLMNQDKNEENIPLPPYKKIVKNEKEEPPIPSYTKIETKTSEVPKNIIEEKLKSPTISGYTISNHTNSKIDPYREEV